MRIQDTVNVLNIRGWLVWWLPLEVVLSARHRSLGTWVGAAGFYMWMKACKRLFPPIHCSNVDKPVARSSRAMGTSNALCILQTPASTGWFLPVIGFHPAIRMWSGWLSHKIPPVTSKKHKQWHGSFWLKTCGSISCRLGRGSSLEHRSVVNERIQLFTCLLTCCSTCSRPRA